MSNNELKINPFLIAIIVATGSIAINGALANAQLIESEFQLNRGGGAQLIGFFVFGYALGHFLVAILSNQLDHFRLLCFSFIGFSSACLISVVCTEYWQFASSRFLQGLFIAPAPIIGRALVRTMGHNRSAAQTMSASSAIFMWAPVITPFLTEYLGNTWSWKATYLFFSVYGLLAFLTVQAKLKNLIFPAAGTKATTFYKLRHSATFQFAAIFGSLVFAMFFALLAIGGDLNEQLGITIATWVFLIGGSYAVGGFISRVALESASPETLIRGSAFVALLSSLSIAALSFSNSEIGILFVGLCCLMSLLAGVSMPNATFMIMKNFTGDASVVLAILGGLKLLVSSGIAFVVAKSNVDPSISISLILLGLTSLSTTCLWIFNLANKHNGKQEIERP